MASSATYRHLTAKLNTGFDIPLFGLGTYKITGQRVVNDAVDAALGAGYRLFDTAKLYNNEKEFGVAFEQLLPKHGLTRSDIFITSKFMLDTNDDNAKVARLAVDESLSLMRTDYIDLMLIHYPASEFSASDDPTNAKRRRDAYLELQILKDENKVRSIGVSNYEISHLEEIKLYGPRCEPAVNQVEFHPHFTRNALHNYCKNEQIFFQAFTSLARQDPALIDDPLLVEIAHKHDTTVQIILLAWALALGVGVVPKSASAQRIAANTMATMIHLDDDEVTKISHLDRNKNYTKCEGWTVL